MADVKFVDGLIFKRSDKAPDFVVGSLSAKVEDLIPFLKDNVKPDGWINMDIKRSKAGKVYIQLDTYVKQEEY